MTGVQTCALPIYPHNVIKATFDALLHLKDAAKVAEGRGKGAEEPAS